MQIINIFMGTLIAALATAKPVPKPDLKDTSPLIIPQRRDIPFLPPVESAPSGAPTSTSANAPATSEPPHPPQMPPHPPFGPFAPPPEAPMPKPPSPAEESAIATAQSLGCEATCAYARALCLRFASNALLETDCGIFFKDCETSCGAPAEPAAPQEEEAHDGLAPAVTPLPTSAPVPSAKLSSATQPPALAAASPSAPSLPSVDAEESDDVPANAAPAQAASSDTSPSQGSPSDSDSADATPTPSPLFGAPASMPTPSPASPAAPGPAATGTADGNSPSP